MWRFSKRNAEKGLWGLEAHVEGPHFESLGIMLKLPGASKRETSTMSRFFRRNKVEVECKGCSCGVTRSSDKVADKAKKHPKFQKQIITSKQLNTNQHYTLHPAHIPNLHNTHDLTSASHAN